MDRLGKLRDGARHTNCLMRSKRSSVLIPMRRCSYSRPSRRPSRSSARCSSRRWGCELALPIRAGQISVLRATTRCLSHPDRTRTLRSHRVRAARSRIGVVSAATPTASTASARADRPAGRGRPFGSRRCPGYRVHRRLRARTDGPTSPKSSPEGGDPDFKKAKFRSGSHPGSKASYDRKRAEG